MNVRRRSSPPKANSLFDALERSFRESLRTPEGVAEPVALLWTDADGQWKPLIARLRSVLPQLYTLGAYAPQERTGPAIWLRCVIDRALPEASPPAGLVPILYLPDVPRQDLRAGTDCPRPLQPLVELQFRGRVWHQRNGRDWTVEAFLVSEDGLGLEIAQDARTREALLRALPLLVDVPAESLDHPLDADDFDRLAISDPTRDLLRWMGTSEMFRKSLDANRWRSFCSVCASDMKLDPDSKSPADAATALVSGGGKWDAVWQRFREAPRLYPGVPQLLRDVKGQFGLGYDRERTPLVNDGAEQQLRAELAKVATLPQEEAIRRVLALEAGHAHRRAWVWTLLGESPLAVALGPLARLATVAGSTLGGASLEDAITLYTNEGWKCDRAALDALVSVRAPSDTALVQGAVKALYEPWLDRSARHFQGLVAREVRAPLPAGKTGTLASSGKSLIEKDTCVVFADGLRFDVAGMLKERLDARGLRTRLDHRLSPLPTVTATAKPLATAVHDALEGGDDAADFTPRLREGGQASVAQRLRDLMAKRGMDLLGDEVRPPKAGTAGAWVETGRLDERGHQLGAALALHLDLELETLVDRIVGLLEHGWMRVRVVTDHGWLLLPGGLPKVDLPTFLTETKWSRCATLKGESASSMPVYGWHWNANVRIASPPGIACFNLEREYAHGGVSPQECIVPDLTVERGAGSTAASITTVSWRGMRCRVAVKTNDPTVTVDLRSNWKLGSSSIVASPKEVGANGEVSLAVADDAHENAAAMVVVVDSAGNVLDRKPTIVGEAS